MRKSIGRDLLRLQGVVWTSVSAAVVSSLCGHSLESSVANTGVVFLLSTFLFFRRMLLPVSLIAMSACFVFGTPDGTLLLPVAFLLGQMLFAAQLQDLGVMTCLVQFAVNRRRLSGATWFLLLGILSLLSSAIFGSFCSAFIMSAMVFQICDAIKIKPLPSIILVATCTNLGAIATPLGSPAALVASSPDSWLFALLMFLPSSLALFFFFRKHRRHLSRRFAEHLKQNKVLGPQLHISCKTGLAALFLYLCANIAVFFLPPQYLPARWFVPLFFASALSLRNPSRLELHLKGKADWPLLAFFAALLIVFANLAKPDTPAFLAPLAGFLFGDLAGSMLAGPLPLAMLGASLSPFGTVSNIALFRLLGEHRHTAVSWREWCIPAIVAAAVSAIALSILILCRQ